MANVCGIDICMDDDDDEWRRGLDRNEGAGLMRSVNCWCGGGG